MGSILDFGRMRSGEKKHQPRNWNNQELAELYRVHDVLNQAGMSVGMESGLSDEGDPWFVFFHTETQDVIAHFARIDGMIVAVAFGSDKILQGRDFSAIIKEILAQHHPVALPPQRPSGNVVKLYLHPAVVLSAFVCAAFALSKKSVAATLDQRSDRSGDDATRSGHGVLADVSASLTTPGGLFTGSVFASSLAIVAAVAQFDDANADEPSSLTVADTESTPQPEAAALPLVGEGEKARLALTATDDPTAASVAPSAHAEIMTGQQQTPQPEASQLFLADNSALPHGHAKPMPTAVVHQTPEAVTESHATVTLQASVVPDKVAAPATASDAATPEAPEAVTFEKVAWTDDYMLLSINFDAVADLSSEQQPVETAQASGEDAPAASGNAQAAATGTTAPAATAMLTIAPASIDVVLPVRNTTVVLTAAAETVYYSGGKVELRNFTAGQDVLLVANNMLANDYTLQVKGDDVTLLFKDGSSLTLHDLWL